MRIGGTGTGSKYDVIDGMVRETQLFNLADNPNEYIAQHHDSAVTSLLGISPTASQVNLADEPKHAEKRKEMEALLLAEMRRLNDPYRMWDQPQDALEADNKSKKN